MFTYDLYYANNVNVMIGVEESSQPLSLIVGMTFPYTGTPTKHLQQGTILTVTADPQWKSSAGWGNQNQTIYAWRVIVS